jgi:hypothetical protein
MRWSGSPPCLPVRVRTCLRATHRQAQTGVPMFPPKAGKPNKGGQTVRYYGYYSPAVGAGSGSTEEGKRGGIGAFHLAAR